MTILKKITPLWNRVVTTMDLYEEDNYINGIVDTHRTKGSLKEYQKVIAVGTTVTSMKEGDVVCIDPTRYMVTKHNEKSLKNGVIGDNMVIDYRFNTITIDGKKCLMLFDSDISFIVEESEEVEDVKPNVVIPKRPRIVT